MKKSTRTLIVGIVMLALAFLADAILGNCLDFSNPAKFEAIHYVSIVVSGILLFGGIVLVVVSRSLAKKEK